MVAAHAVLVWCWIELGAATALLFGASAWIGGIIGAWRERERIDVYLGGPTREREKTYYWGDPPSTPDRL